MTPIRFQLLACAVEIETDDAGVRAALAYLVQNANQSLSPHVFVRYDVRTLPDGRFLIHEDGDEVACESDAVGVMECIYTRCHAVAYRALPPHLRLHAACATIGGQRIILVGAKEAGKTTLSLRLAFDGSEVHSDETMMIMADGLSLPFPRRFHVRASTLPLIPELAGRSAEIPQIALPAGGRIFSFGLAEFGLPWTCYPARVDAIVFLEPNHGAGSTIRKLDTVEAIDRLRRHLSFSERSVEWMAVLFDVVGGARTFLLRNGDLVASASAVRGIMVQANLD